MRDDTTLRTQRTRRGHITGSEMPLSGVRALGDMVVHPTLMREVLDLVTRVTPSDASVLLTGENGVGVVRYSLLPSAPLYPVSAARLSGLLWLCANDYSSSVPARGQNFNLLSLGVSSFLSSLPPNARRIGRAIWGYWSIENSLH